MKTPARLRLAEKGALKGTREGPFGVTGSPVFDRAAEAALRQLWGMREAQCGISPSASGGGVLAWLRLFAASASDPTSSSHLPIYG